MRAILIRRGAKHNIHAVGFPGEKGERDKCQTLAFFQEQSKRNASEMDKLAVQLTEFAEKGPPHNDQKFKDLPGTGLYEFKTHGGLRLMCFWDDNGLIICTHGYLKGSQKAPMHEINRAKQIKANFLDAKQKGTLVYGTKK